MRILLRSNRSIGICSFTISTYTCLIWRADVCTFIVCICISRHNILCRNFSCKCLHILFYSKLQFISRFWIQFYVLAKTKFNSPCGILLIWWKEAKAFIIRWCCNTIFNLNNFCISSSCRIPVYTQELNVFAKSVVNYYISHLQAFGNPI